MKQCGWAGLALIILLNANSATAKNKEINPQAETLYKLSYKAASEKSYDDAVAYLNRALTIEPKYEDALFNLGSLYLAMGNYQEAYFFLQRLVDVAPNDDQAKLQKTLALIGTGNLQEAYRTIRDVSRDSERYETVKARLDDARDRLSAAENEIPDGLYGKNRRVQAANNFNLFFDLKAPTGVAVGDKYLYVASFLEDKIERFTLDGKNRKVVVAGSPLAGPSGVVYDSSRRRLLVTNYKSGTVVAIDEDGESQVIADKLDKPYSIYLNEDILYITEQGKNAISTVKLRP